MALELHRETKFENSSMKIVQQLNMSLEMQTFKLIKTFAQIFNTICSETDTEEEQYNKMMNYFKEIGLKAQPYLSDYGDKVKEFLNQVLALYGVKYNEDSITNFLYLNAEKLDKYDSYANMPVGSGAIGARQYKSNSEVVE